MFSNGIQIGSQDHCSSAPLPCINNSFILSGGCTGAPRHCLGAPDLLEQRNNGLEESYGQMLQDSLVSDLHESRPQVVRSQSAWTPFGIPIRVVGQVSGNKLLPNPYSPPGYSHSTTLYTNPCPPSRLCH